ncbi:MAG: hypothetical protein ACRD3B_10675 [Candidatus Sulfotelmatobacter sp.]
MIKFARHRPTWFYTPPRSANQISDFPLVPETPVNVRPPAPPADIDPAYLNPPPVPEQPCEPQPGVRVELIREPDPAPLISIEAETKPAAEPAAPPVLDAPPPKPKKKYKKRPRRKPRCSIEEEFALVQKGTLTPVGHHERLCLVCRSPFRENIEEEFIHWHNVHEIAQHYGIEPRTIYRHARAFNLYDQRDRNLRFSLVHIIHRAQNVRVTADSVVRAVHHFARINRDGHWVDPPTHVIVSSGSRAQTPPSDPPPADAIDVTLPSDELATLLDTASRIEHDPTR